jgi:uncharacterized protein (DUF1697 family)
MAELKALYQSLGWTHIQTLLQTGNALFVSDNLDPEVLTAQIEAAIVQRFGFESRVMLRTPQELQVVFQQHPLADLPVFDPQKVLVTFLRDVPDPAQVERLFAAHKGPERIHVIGREAYVYYPEGVGRSKLDNLFIEKHLKTAGTARNWNTVTKLVDLLGSES